MRQIQQAVYIFLYLHFFICNVFTFNIDVSSKENINTNDLMWINEWKCNSNNDCTAKNSVCSNQLCQCAPEYIFNTDMTACVKVATRLYDTCEETVQCSAYLLSGAKCIENVCVCGPGYYYLHGRCNQYIGLFEKCKQNVDCYVNADFEASICDEGICKCSRGFYQREYRTCRREGKAVGDECTIDIDCSFDNATCNNFICAIKYANKAVELSSDIILTKKFLDNGTRIGSTCTTDEDCKVVKNAICDPAGTCRCDRAHFASTTDTKCIPELGELCQNDNVSYIQKSICREGRWSCSKGTVASKNNRECLDTTREYMGNCHLDEQCYIFGPDAVCNNNKCVCNENVSHYVESELFCWGNTGIGQTCKQDRDCYVKDFKSNLTCNVTCGCPDGTRLSKDKMSCIGSTDLGGVCEINSDCAVPFSICQKGICTCAKNHYESYKQCLAGINADCTDDEDCAPVNSICISKNCLCKANYVSVSIDSCMPVSLFGKPCLLDIQCSVITPGAICATNEQSNDTADIMELIKIAENKVCNCSKEDYYRFGNCFKKKFLGETCTNLGECYENWNQNRVVCRNGKCACIWGYMTSNGVCVKHPQSSQFFLNGATNVVSRGLFLITSFILSSKLF
ncbi:PREDICTED: prion-like-(Q/N-rich) domain-bearing protein 25 [Trachymyrmex septentrionalis]|uniref:prion-like-(Q/N-rich) domain-bearing protein 25 n=1 Tax=Trachymyrmex septentrionalis TaxID=34720 RepID=UPI00084EEE4D|nr:PREDICTED: prion-like-(Q/N-rich) domain-bearing protein 25 [Trachymyrmex septentrionalis]